MAEAAEGPKKRGKALLLLVLLPLVLALGGAAAAIFTGLVPSPLAGEDAAAASLDPAAAPTFDPDDVVFVDLPELLVNLNVTGARLRFLKFSAALEVRTQAEADLVHRFAPRVTDNIHAYLRAVAVEELGGPDAVHRVKQDLLARVNQVLSPVRVRDVLIKEMLVQ